MGQIHREACDASVREGQFAAIRIKTRSGGATPNAGGDTCQRCGGWQEHSDSRRRPTAFRKKATWRPLMNRRVVRSSRRQPSTSLRRTRIALSRRKRRRLQYSRQYLRDARRAELSMHSRFRCAFECIYMCLLEVAETTGTHVVGRKHPMSEVVRAGTKRLNIPARHSEAIERLTEWAASANPFGPDDSFACIWHIAKEVFSRTEQLLAGRRMSATRGVRRCVSR